MTPARRLTVPSGRPVRVTHADGGGGSRVDARPRSREGYRYDPVLRDDLERKPYVARPPAIYSAMTPRVVPIAKVTP